MIGLSSDENKLQSKKSKDAKKFATMDVIFEVIGEEDNETNNL